MIMIVRKSQSLQSKINNLKVGESILVSTVRSKGGYDQCHIRKCVMKARQSVGVFSCNKEMDDYTITRNK